MKEGSRTENLRFASESLRPQGELNDAMQQDSKILLFSSARSGCNEGDAAAYLNLLRSEALQKARARLRNGTATKDVTDDHSLTEGEQHILHRFSVCSFPEMAGEREIFIR